MAQGLAVAAVVAAMVGFDDTGAVGCAGDEELAMAGVDVNHRTAVGRTSDLWSARVTAGRMAGNGAPNHLAEFLLRDLHRWSRDR